MQFPPKKGEYTSAPFKTGLLLPYTIDLDWPKPIPEDKQIWLDIDWRIVDDKGGVVTRGSYNDWIVGDAQGLTGYPQGSLKRQRLVLTLPHDVQRMNDDMRLKISVDEGEVSLEMSYVFAPAILWACVTAGPGAIILLVLLISRQNRREAPGKLF
jgi:hypothetical protein